MGKVKRVRDSAAVAVAGDDAEGGGRSRGGGREVAETAMGGPGIGGRWAMFLSRLVGVWLDCVASPFWGNKSAKRRG